MNMNILCIILLNTTTGIFAFIIMSNRKQALACTRKILPIYLYIEHSEMIRYKGELLLFPWYQYLLNFSCTAPGNGWRGFWKYSSGRFWKACNFYVWSSYSKLLRSVLPLARGWPLFIFRDLGNKINVLKRSFLWSVLIQRRAAWFIF